MEAIQLHLKKVLEINQMFNQQENELDIIDYFDDPVIV